MVGTASSYTLASSDIGHTITLTETATNPGGTGAPHTSMVSGAVRPSTTQTAPADSLAPLIYGQVVAGQVLTAYVGAWEGTPPLTYTYQWLLCGAQCAPIAGATGPTYTVVTFPPAEAHDYLQLVVTATNSVGSGQAISNGLGPVPTAAAAPSP